MIVLASCSADESSLGADVEPSSADVEGLAEGPDAGAADVPGCTEDELGADELTAFVSAHRVVGGELSTTCFGVDDADLLDAWDALATITPAGQLSDLALFSGFESGEDGAEVTLAYVVAIDDDGSQYQMAINLPEYAANPDEALLTMAHEFTHVFNQVPTQLDRSDESFDDCSTYHNGDGCYRDDSLMWAWIEAFWPADVLAEVDPFEEATSAGGQDRCDRDAGFFGPYAASTPDEDFAESFSAFVFDVPAATPEQQQRLDWMAAQPGLVEFRDRARAAGLTPVPNEFETCG